MRLLRWKSHNIKLIILNWAIQCHLVLLQCCIQPPPLSSSETVLLLHSKTSHQSAVPPHFSLPLQPSVCIFVLMGLPILDVYIESYNMWPFTFGFFACMCAQSVTQLNGSTETFVAILTCPWSDVSLVRSLLSSITSQLTILFSPSRPSSNAVLPKKSFLLIYINVHFSLLLYFIIAYWFLHSSLWYTSCLISVECLHEYIVLYRVSLQWVCWRDLLLS